MPYTLVRLERAATFSTDTTAVERFLATATPVRLAHAAATARDMAEYLLTPGGVALPESLALWVALATLAQRLTEAQQGLRAA